MKVSILRLFIAKPNLPVKFLLFFLSLQLININVHASVTCHTLGEQEDIKAIAQVGEMISFQTPGDKPAKGYFIKSEKESDNYLFVFHEGRGLSDFVKKQAEKLYKDLEDVNVLAIDLYDGELADKEALAEELMDNFDDERAEDIIKGAMDIASKNARIATIGWGFGGTWSLQAGIIAGAHSVATVMYYGEPEGDKDKLKMLQAPVLAIYGSKDDSIPQDDLDEFEEEMDEVEKELDLEMFDADHAFANPDNSKFNEKASEKAYKKGLKFLKKGFERGYF